MMLSVTAGNYPHFDKVGYRHDRIQSVWIQYASGGMLYRHMWQLWHDEIPSSLEPW